MSAEPEPTSVRSRRTAVAILLVALLGVAGFAGVRVWERMQPIPKPERPPLAVAVERAEPGTFRVGHRYTGTVKAMRRATVGARIGATVTAIPHREGAKVAEGAVLVRLDDDEPAAEIRRLKAMRERLKNDRAFWQKQVQRDRTLYRKGNIPERSLDESIHRLAGIEAQLDENRHAREAAQTRLGYTVITAPFAATVQAVHTELGEVTAPGKPLVELVSRERLKVVVPVPQGDLARLREGQPLRVRLPETGETWQATIHHLYPAVEDRTRTATLEGRLPPSAAAALRPGMSIEAQAVAERFLDAITVPLQALHERKDGSGVFVAEDGEARWRPVAPGPDQDGRVLVRSGIEPGSRVVVTPSPDLADGRAVRVAGSGDAG
ncbi:MAG TPA: efflux RND transporter periplasmic adaptor subunit [Gammaproteobacteria bacterium]|nr:efflux RND transporter periplasmic adaptor subunit [Gammaproteobacteria bacterium]